METPSSARRVPISQTLNDLSNNNPISRTCEEESEKGMSKSTKRNNVSAQDRSALIDITNDSPIIGLATGSTQTPSSAFAKQRNSTCKKTPGSGEALLRGTVKNLLQKVEEEEGAGLPKLSFKGHHGPFLNLRRYLGSPMGLLAPTPANTPQILNPDMVGTGTVKNELMGSADRFALEDQMMLSQGVREMLDEKRKEKDAVDSESEKSVITRTLLFDFSEKLESADPSDCCSSTVNYQGRSSRSVTEDEHASSVWSIQVSASARDEEDDDEDAVIGSEEEEDYCEYDEGDNDQDVLLDELCLGMGKMSVKMGKHTRFVYNSDDEIVEEKVDNGDILPKGKHLRFLVEEEEDD